MAEYTYEELVETWIRFAKAEHSTKEYHNLFWSFSTVLESVQKQPNQAWQFIVDVWTRDQSDKTISYLFSGHLEDLLSFHGPEVIERVEQKAKADPQFANALGGVWQFQMSDEIWARVQNVWDRRGWDGIPKDDPAK
jgi:hypothetical protein